MASYYHARTFALPFDEAVSRTIDALKREGFGVITDIDLKKTFKEKLGQDFRRYRILGACNPQAAREALGLEDKIGTMLPCNIVVQEKGSDGVQVAAIDPVASMQAIDNPALKSKAKEIGGRLRRAIDTL